MYINTNGLRKSQVTRALLINPNHTMQVQPIDATQYSLLFIYDGGLQSGSRGTDGVS